MPLYSCDVCNFRSNLKSDYFRHLNTKKHKKNKAKQDENLKKNIKSPYNSLTNPHNCEGIPSQTLTIVREKKHTFLDHTDSEIYNCEKCGKEFSRKDNLKRHSEKYCGDSNPKNFKDLFLLMKEEHKQEKEDLKKQIEGLLTKVGNNISVGNKTNNTTINNTIVLNNYGQEDLSHITDALKTQLLKIPYGMIPKMIEHVHFNDQKPENKNIMLTNSRDNKLKIYKNNKWIYRDKNETLNDLVDSKYFILDTHFETTQESDDNSQIDELNEFQHDNYKKFKDLIDTSDKSVIENIKKECEFILLNNR
jgi:hypothetical protein